MPGAQGRSGAPGDRVSTKHSARSLSGFPVALRLKTKQGSITEITVIETIDGKLKIVIN